jgi:Tfp pilus assembly protein PilV
MGIMKATKKSLKERGGFTLLEAMIAFSILAVGLLSMADLFLMSVNNTAKGGKRTQAVMLAQQKIEEFKNTKYDNIAPGADANKINAFGNATAAANKPTLYTRTWTITEDAPNQIKTVTVTVKWPKSTAYDNQSSFNKVILATKIYTKT